MNEELRRNTPQKYYRVLYIDDRMNECSILQAFTDEEINFIDFLQNMYGRLNIDEYLDEYKEKFPDSADWFTNRHILGVDTIAEI